MTSLIQISDTHLLPGGELLHGRVDTAAALEAALDAVLAGGGRVDALLLTGDLTDGGAPEAYRKLRTLVEPAAEKLGASLVYAMGNHDERRAFGAELLSISDDQARDAVHWIGELRVIVLDSTTPGRHEGHLEPEQLAWLRAELATPAPLGTVLVVHHPPLPSPVPGVHLLRLHEAQALASVLDGTDVGIIVTGHAHHTGCGVLSGIPVWISPALAYRVDALPPRGRQRGLAGSGISRIDLIDGSFVATAIGIEDAPAIYDEDDETMLSRIQAVMR